MRQLIDVSKHALNPILLTTRPSSVYFNVQILQIIMQIRLLAHVCLIAPLVP